MKLVANKSFRYATRQLVAGDEFEAKPMHGRMLVAIGKASATEESEQPSTRKGKAAAKARPKAKAKADPEREPEAPKTGQVGATDVPMVPSPEQKNRKLETLRSEYRARFGKPPAASWDADTLQSKIDGAR